MKLVLHSHSNQMKIISLLLVWVLVLGYNGNAIGQTVLITRSSLWDFGKVIHHYIFRSSILLHSRNKFLKQNLLLIFSRQTNIVGQWLAIRLTLTQFTNWPHIS